MALYLQLKTLERHPALKVLENTVNLVDYAESIDSDEIKDLILNTEKNCKTELISANGFYNSKVLKELKEKGLKVELIGKVGWNVKGVKVILSNGFIETRT